MSCRGIRPLEGYDTSAMLEASGIAEVFHISGAGTGLAVESSGLLIFFKGRAGKGLDCLGTKFTVPSDEGLFKVDGDGASDSGTSAADCWAPVVSHSSRYVSNAELADEEVWTIETHWWWAL